MVRKGQLEILGLVVVVVLILLGMVFAIRYIILEPGSEVGATFKKTQLSANFLSSLLSTTSKDCYQATVKDLILDCYEKGTNGLTCETGKKSCAMVQEIVDVALSDTLAKWGKKYEFSICDWDSVNDACFGTPLLSRETPDGCRNAKSSEDKLVPLPVAFGDEKMVKITLCD